MSGEVLQPALRLAVIGDPVAHSQSPRIVRDLLASSGIAGSYEAIRVPAGACASAIDALRARGFHGLNVTTPLKEEAFARAETHDACSAAAGSVNTLVLGASVSGHNTDGAGAVGALRDAGLGTLAGRRILVLGAGPTARAACVALSAGGARVFLWNRTAGTGRAVARALGVDEFAPGEPYAAVFAALPPHAVPPEGALRSAVCAAPLLLDANYAARATLGAALGRSAQDGSAMLRHGAAASFALWRSAWEAGRFATAPVGGEGEIRTPETF